MGLFTQIVMFIIIISVLVVLHELGHFLPAKYFKTKVEKFYLFFDVKFSLFKKKIGETVYGIGWLPLGGYVKIAGMIDESMDTEQMKKEPEPWEFRSKPAWQRLIIMLGGVTVNFLLAWLIYSSLLFFKGDTYIPSNKLKYGIEVDEVGEKLGLKTGDQIVAIDGKPSKRFNDAVIDIILGDEITVERNGGEVTFPLTSEGKKEVFEAKGRGFMTFRSKPIIDQVVDTMIAKKAGIKKGDEIVGVNNKPIEYWGQFVEVVRSSENKDLSIDLLRDGRKQQINLKVPKDGRIGVSIDNSDLFVTDEYGFFGAIPAGFIKTIEVLTKQIKQFKVIGDTKTGAYKQVKGPIGIVEMMPTSWDWTFFWSFMAMFSVWLAFLNILPIPALDGGHVMFLLYEMITGKEPSQKVLERGQIIGFVILMSLMVVIFGNDIWNIIKRMF